MRSTRDARGLARLQEPGAQAHGLPARSGQRRLDELDGAARPDDLDGRGDLADGHGAEDVERQAADDEVEDDQVEQGDDEDESGPASPPPPRPKAGATVELIVPLTAAQHDEVTGLIADIRARDGDMPLAEVVMTALRAYAERQR